MAAVVVVVAVVCVVHTEAPCVVWGGRTDIWRVLRLQRLVCVYGHAWSLDSKVCLAGPPPHIPASMVSNEPRRPASIVILPLFFSSFSSLHHGWIRGMRLSIMEHARRARVTDLLTFPVAVVNSILLLHTASTGLLGYARGLFLC